VGDLRIDYGDLQGLVDEGVRRSEGRRRRRAGLRSLPGRLARAVALGGVLAVLPFALLVRGGVYAYQSWGMGTWTALAFSASASAGLLGAYAWLAARKLRAGRGVRRFLTRSAVSVAVVYVVYGLVFVASENVTSEAVRGGYATVHPLLRLAASGLVLADPDAVLTDTGRTPDDYRLMGLRPRETSLHFEQETGFVHALDLRTRGRSELRNRAVELGFWALGFHSLRHVGTADHLHLSLRPAEGPAGADSRP